LDHYHHDRALRTSNTIIITTTTVIPSNLCLIFYVRFWDWHRGVCLHTLTVGREMDTWHHFTAASGAPMLAVAYRLQVRLFALGPPR
jgi:hypothetical protein